ncbi:Cacna1c [Symbiodinium sp. CCMP2592]|nr:Cacna1c [Symbiodinium sp. CCMP2592]
MADFKLKVDESNKATELPLLRICGTVQQNPHMRAFGGSVFSFFLAFLGWFALAPLGLEVATSINMCENQKFPPAENPLRPAYLKYKSLKTGLEYCQYGKIKDGDVMWRDRLRGSVSACFKWVRGASATYTHVVCLGDETASDSLSDAIDRLKQYWESVWNRPLPNLDDQFASCARVLGPSRETAEWCPLQGSELHKAAQIQAGTKAYGGRRGAGTYDAVASLLDGIHKGAYLGTFDYSLAFDCVRPRLVERLWKHFGMPAGPLNMVMSVWCGQRRYLQLFDAVCPNPALVSTSIPQGDPWSMLAMVCMLVAPLVDIKSSHPGVVVSLYVDDRSWVTDTAVECLRVAQRWRGWSARLGLNENGDKDQFFQISRAGRRKLIENGADPLKVTDSPKILGVMLKPASGQKSKGAEAQRLQAARWTLQRVKCLPVSFAVKVLVAGMSAMSKASYGWVCRLPILKEANSVDWASIGPLPALVVLLGRVTPACVRSCLGTIAPWSFALRLIRSWLFVVAC